MGEAVFHNLSARPVCAAHGELHTPARKQVPAALLPDTLVDHHGIVLAALPARARARAGAPTTCLPASLLPPRPPACVQVGVPRIVVFLNKCDVVEDKELQVGRRGGGGRGGDVRVLL